MNDKIKITIDNIPAKGLDPMPLKTLKELAKEISKMTNVNLPEEPGLNYGINETRDVIVCGIQLANSVIKTLDDGKVTIGDIPNFIAPVMKLPAAISGITMVPAELNDLDEVELQEITEFVQNNLEVDSATAQEIIKQSIQTIYSIYKLAKLIKK